MLLSFETAGSWRTADLVRFLNAIESIYNVFLAASHTRRAMGREMDTLLKEWGAPVQEYREADDINEDEIGAPSLLG